MGRAMLRCGQWYGWRRVCYRVEMPELSRSAPQTTQTQQTPRQTSVQTAGQAADLSNSFLADLLAGRSCLDGAAEDWFSQGIHFQRGMRGDLIKQVQSAIGAGADGSFGPKTEALLKQFQKQRGMPESGVVDRATWERVVASGPMLQGEQDFEKMWANHPHNYQADASQNTSSDALRTELGLKESDASNTCALRMSVMFNRLGGGHELTHEKGRAAGLDKMRDAGLYMPKINDKQTANTNDRAILSAKEMWTYIEHKRGRPDLVFPAPGSGRSDRYKTEEDARQGVEELKKQLTGKKGFIAFDKIFGYSGSGHIDLFDGQTLSDAGDFYPSQQIKIWFVAK